MGDREIQRELGYRVSLVGGKREEEREVRRGGGEKGREEGRETVVTCQKKNGQREYGLERQKIALP